MILAPREVLFPDDNHGNGPWVTAVHYPAPMGWSFLHGYLTSERLDCWLRNGVREILLEAHGFHNPLDLYLAPALPGDTLIPTDFPL